MGKSGKAGELFGATARAVMPGARRVGSAVTFASNAHAQAAATTGDEGNRGDGAAAFAGAAGCSDRGDTGDGRYGRALRHCDIQDPHLGCAVVAVQRFGI